RLATGDALNVAARLQQAAQPNEFLIGAETVALARGAVDVTVLEPLVLKGKALPVQAYRLLGLTEFPEPPHRPQFVGRTQELRTITNEWGRVSKEARCALVTIVGEAGVGKSRLVGEFLSSVGASRVVRGRCLPYGEGITYW